jgi:uroporphyrinogen decarboxylase
MSFWGHFYHRESTAADLVAATLEFHERYRWDWVKLNPRKHYHVEPWGVRYRYSGIPGIKPVLESWPVHRGEDWARVTARPHDEGALGEQIEAVRLLRRALPEDVPMVQTVFTPLAILGEMVNEPEDLQQHLESHPTLVRAALNAVTETFVKYVRAVIEAGADGIYLAAVDWASRDLLDPAEHRTWARPWDEALLRAAEGAPFNVLHVCRRNNLLFELADYRVAAFSWAATEPTNPSLGEALKELPGAVMGGIAHEGSLQQLETAPVLAELESGFEQTGGRRWLAAPGCSIPPSTRPELLQALRGAIERMHPQRER